MRMRGQKHQVLSAQSKLRVLLGKPSGNRFLDRLADPQQFADDNRDHLVARFDQESACMKRCRRALHEVPGIAPTEHADSLEADRDGFSAYANLHTRNVPRIPPRCQTLRVSEIKTLAVSLVEACEIPGSLTEK